MICQNVVPICHLITAYCNSCDITFSELTIRSIRNIVALMVLAAKIDVLMSIQVFEKMTSQLKAKLCEDEIWSHHLDKSPLQNPGLDVLLLYLMINPEDFSEPPIDSWVLWNSVIGIYLKSYIQILSFIMLLNIFFLILFHSWASLYNILSRI